LVFVKTETINSSLGSEIGISGPTRLTNASCDKAPAKALDVVVSAESRALYLTIPLCFFEVGSVDVVESAFSVSLTRRIGLAESRARYLTIPLCFCDVGWHFGFAGFDSDFLVVILWAPLLG